MNVERAYSILEDSVTYGFIYRGLSYKDNIFMLKTISDKENNLIPFYTTGDDSEASLCRLAFSTFMINGYNFLKDRNENIRNLIDFYKNSPVTFIQALVKHINEIYKDFTDSLSFLEGFCYTNRSRVLWDLYRGSNCRICVVEGSENLGINSVQETWILVNRQLDDEEDYNTQFRLSLMIASSMNSKGCQKIENQYEAHKKELGELRKDIAKYGRDKSRILDKEKARNGWAAPLETREDMVRELNRQMSGDRDKHDVFIDDWIQAAKDKAAEEERLVQERVRIFRENLKRDIDFTKVEDSRIATPEEVQRMMNNKHSNSISVATEPIEKTYSQMDVIKKVSGTVIKSAN